MNTPASFRTKGWRCSFTDFSSADLERISGMDGAAQRVWRSRGNLPGTTKPKVSFNSREVTEIMARFALSKMGEPPSESGDIGCRAAQLILWFALINSDGACEVYGKTDDVDAFLRAFERDDAVASALTGSPRITRFLCKEASGELRFQRNLERFTGELGPMWFSVLDLEKAAARLSEVAQRPLFTVEVSRDTHEKRVRRLTGQRLIN